jgi:hypothetical protein
MTAFRARGALAPKPLGGWRHSTLDPHRVFILRRVAEKDAISMPELAGELKAASGVKADPASLSRWLIRNGLSFKKRMARPVCKRFYRDRCMISLLQRIRPRRLSPGQDGDTRALVLISLAASSAVF